MCIRDSWNRPQVEIKAKFLSGNFVSVCNTVEPRYNELKWTRFRSLVINVARSISVLVIIGLFCIGIRSYSKIDSWIIMVSTVLAHFLRYSMLSKFHPTMFGNSRTSKSRSTTNEEIKLNSWRFSIISMLCCAASYLYWLKCGPFTTQEIWRCNGRNLLIYVNETVRIRVHTCRH